MNLSTLLHRYAYSPPSTSSLDVVDDLVDQLHALSKPAVMRDVMAVRHGHGSYVDLTAAAAEAAALVDQGLQFLEQAARGPALVSFLPYYYALLQFSKAIVFCRMPERIFQKNLRHGVSYDPARAAPSSVEFDRVQLKNDGVFSLLHEALTGHRSPVGSVELGTIFPFLLDASVEYAFAFGRQSHFTQVEVEVESSGPGIEIRCTEFQPSNMGSAAGAPLLSAFSNGLVQAANLDEALSKVPRYLLYKGITIPDLNSFTQLRYFTPSRPHPLGLRLAEEVPIFLTLFYLGSIARYRPIYLREVDNSRQVTFLRVVRRHCTAKMLLLTHEAIWSETYFVVRP